MRTILKHTINSIDDFKLQLLTWSQQFDEVVWLDSNDYSKEFSSYDAILAVDALTSIKTDVYMAFDKLKEYQTSTNDWLFGYLTYDLKNDLERLKSENYDGLEFSDLFFFQPKKIFLLKGNVVETHYLNFVNDELDLDLDEIQKINIPKAEHGNVHSEEKNASSGIAIKQRIEKGAYLDKVNAMLAHIHRGDIYEANFCQEFYAEEVIIDPLEVFQKLNHISKPPFATYLKSGHHYLLSASPERYLKKLGSTVISQPIKGTAKRSTDPKEDAKLKLDLENDIKERSENIMIVDLVRNDLSHTAIRGSVNVTELCKVYSFSQVHHLISTVTSQVLPTTHPVEIIKTTFPMGSMTGAPKISAMNIIENLEETKRGLYSGAVGYFTPQGDFDFNVVIRSILYNQKNKYLSFSVGSAITSRSIPLNEYDECLLKAKAMYEVLNN